MMEACVCCRNWTQEPKHALSVELNNVSTFLQRKSCSYSGTDERVQSSCQGGWEVIDRVKKGIYPYKDFDFNGKKLDAFLHLQTFKRFSGEELFAKVIMVRFDSNILLREELDTVSPSVSNAIHTIRYLNEAGAKVILVSDWSKNLEAELLRGESVADFLSLVLWLKVATARCASVSMGSKLKELEKEYLLLLENLSEFKEESANFVQSLLKECHWELIFFVNDALSQSHRVLASTIDGVNFLQKAAALQFLASICNGLVFIGIIAFQIMHAQGLLVPSNLVEYGALEEASNLIQFAQCRNIPILHPKEFLCMSTYLPVKLKMLPAHDILDGWVPVDLAPNLLDEIEQLLLTSKLFPFKIDWDATYCNPAKPLAVEIGSGFVHQSGIRNGYFIATNATSTFRSIIASYPGNLVLVSTQCPNPDFKRPEHRWRMVQRSLVGAVADLASDGKVFLQSDTEAVTVRMKEQFMKYGKGKLIVSKNQDDAKVNQGGLKKTHSEYAQIGGSMSLIVEPQCTD